MSRRQIADVDVAVAASEINEAIGGGQVATAQLIGGGEAEAVAAEVAELDVASRDSPEVDVARCPGKEIARARNRPAHRDVLQRAAARVVLRTAQDDLQLPAADGAIDGQLLHRIGDRLGNKGGIAAGDDDIASGRISLVDPVVDGRDRRDVRRAHHAVDGVIARAADQHQPVRIDGGQRACNDVATAPHVGEPSGTDIANGDVVGREVRRAVAAVHGLHEPPDGHLRADSGAADVAQHDIGDRPCGCQVPIATGLRDLRILAADVDAAHRGDVVALDVRREYPHAEVGRGRGAGEIAGQDFVGGAQQQRAGAERAGADAAIAGGGAADDVERTVDEDAVVEVAENNAATRLACAPHIGTAAVDAADAQRQAAARRREVAAASVEAVVGKIREVDGSGGGEHHVGATGELRFDGLLENGRAAGGATAVGDREILRVDQQRAPVADLQATAHLYIAVARELHEAAAEQTVAARQDGRTVGKEGVLRGDDARAAAPGAGNIQHRTVGDRDVVGAANRDAAAFAARARRIERAAVDDVATDRTQHDLASDFVDARRAHQAAVVDGRGGKLTGRFGGHEHPATVGHEFADVGDTRGIRQRRAVDAVADEAGIVEVERQPATGGEQHIAQPRLDQPAVAHVAARQHDEAAVAGCQRTLVADRAGCLAAREHVVPGHEVGIVDVEGGGNQRTHIHPCARAEHHALRIDEEHPAIGIEVAEDLAGVTADDAVEHRRRGRGLDELHTLAAADAELLPVDDRAGAVLLDGGEA